MNAAKVNTWRNDVYIKSTGISVAGYRDTQMSPITLSPVSLKPFHKPLIVHRERLKQKREERYEEKYDSSV